MDISQVGGAPRTIYERQNDMAILKHSNGQFIPGIKIFHYSWIPKRGAMRPLPGLDGVCYSVRKISCLIQGVGRFRASKPPINAQH
jgi:hypothetical protein